jgi:hypothetical protein
MKSALFETLGFGLHGQIASDSLRSEEESDDRHGEGRGHVQRHRGRGVQELWRDEQHERPPKMPAD